MSKAGLLLAAAATLIYSAQQFFGADSLLVLTHVTVIDASGRAAQPDVTIVVRGDRIEQIDKRSRIKIPRFAQVIEARGKFVIPGLWDMHAHPFLTKESFFPGFIMNLYVANGVTGLRDMCGPLEEGKQWQKAIETDAVLGPRLVMAGPLLTGPVSYFPEMSISVRNETEARGAVRTVKSRGADFAKIHDSLSRETYLAIADEAKKQGIPFAGHVPAGITALEASDAGQRSIEHLTNIALACSSRAKPLQKDWSAALLEPDPAIGLRALSRVESEGLLHLDRVACHDVAIRFARNRTWQDPTLVVLRVAAFGNDRTLADDPRLRYVPKSIRNGWSVEKNHLWKAFTPNDFIVAQKAFLRFLEIVKILHAAGVKFLAGTDPPVPYCFPGFSVHDEMMLFVDAGFSPMEALQTATRNPAEFFERLNDLGTVEKGKIADLVVLDSNPLEDIRNTRKISGVVLRGKYLSRTKLDGLLATVASGANRE